MQIPGRDPHRVHKPKDWLAERCVRLEMPPAADLSPADQIRANKTCPVDRWTGSEHHGHDRAETQPPAKTRAATAGARTR
mmetsp:Transcript_20750/g.43458  ORF Transcript_20750/g.43458 Transcript_20750/m.43458 type:complete len:80 (+) Transcript_20750:1012-1251(+)